MRPKGKHARTTLSQPRGHDVACSVVLGLVIAATSTASVATVGVRELAFLANSPFQGLIIAGAGVGIFAIVALACYALLRNIQRLLDWADGPKPWRFLALELDKKHVAIASAVILVCWIPWIILQFPAAISADTYNQLYQFQTSAPTYYTTLDTTVEESFIDHHPVFDTLLYGAFLTLGDAIGSQNAGLFAFSLVQCALTAIALGLSCCYLERLGVPWTFRLVSLAFCALFPPIPLWAASMVKDSTNACVFVFFCLLVVEVVRTRGGLFDSKAMVVAYLVVACLCILTKKSGAIVVVAATIALMLYAHSRWIAFAVELVAPLVLCFAVVPLVVYPAIGGVAPGGTQEAFGFAFQQVVTAVNETDDLADWERDAAARVLDLDKARTSYQPGIVDPVKNNAVAGASMQDYLAFVPAYFSIGLRHLGAYTASVFHIAGALITPGRTFTYLDSPEQKESWIELFEKADVNGELHLTFDKPEPIASAAASFESFWRTGIPKLGPLRVFFDAGFYGGWIPLICLIICLFNDKRFAVGLVPMLATLAIVVMSPAPLVRYVLPMLCTTPLMLGLACASLYLRTLTRSGRAPRHASATSAGYGAHARPRLNGGKDGAPYGA